MPQDIHVPFTPADVAQVEGFVAEMQAVKNNIHKVQQTLEQAHGNQMAGKLAELAFGRHFGWPVDFSIGLGGDMDYDYTLALLAAERLSTHFVQILVDVAFTHAVITGGISRERFLTLATPRTGWNTDGEAPLAVKRSQLSHAFPASFWSGI